jgi:hypothetical protein
MDTHLTLTCVLLHAKALREVRCVLYSRRSCNRSRLVAPACAVLSPHPALKLTLRQRTFGKQDPFVTLTLGGRVYRTKTNRGAAHNDVEARARRSAFYSSASAFLFALPLLTKQQTAGASHSSTRTSVSA